MGERHTSKTEYRFEVHIPKRQVLRKQKCGCPQRSDLRGDAVHLSSLKIDSADRTPWSQV